MAVAHLFQIDKGQGGAGLPDRLVPVSVLRMQGDEQQPPDGEEYGNPRSRWLYLALGFFFVGLGVLGAFLPVLPTTSPLLVALWAFSRSSRRFHRWLYTHPRFGPRLQEWKKYGTIPVKVKVTAISMMLLSLAFLAVTHAKWQVIAASGALMLVGAAYILSRPSRPRS
jgi:uncharacterized membrane protein YbaN (DUF454 family)